MIKMFLETGLQEFLLSLHLKKENPLWSLITFLMHNPQDGSRDIFFECFLVGVL